MNRNLIKFILFFIGCFSCSGGGSTGTGSVTIEGSVSRAVQSPIPGAEVTIDGTREVVTTDDEGKFFIEHDLRNSTDGNITLTVDSAEIKRSAIIKDLNVDSEAVNINMILNRQEFDLNGLKVQPKIVGLCDFYFENTKVIRQGNAVPVEGINCRLEVSMTVNGVPLENAKFAVQTRACPDDSPWQTIAVGETASGLLKGKGELRFFFQDTSNTCVYRILAPIELERLNSTSTEIHSFTKQAFDHN